MLVCVRVCLSKQEKDEGMSVCKMWRLLACPWACIMVCMRGRARAYLSLENGKRKIKRGVWSIRCYVAQSLSRTR